GGATLSAPEVVIFTLLLLVAGNETTTNLLGNTVLALTRNPDQLARVQREPRLLDSAVEEILRWTSPIVHMSRTAARDVELRGQKIRAGELVGLFYPSANRDEAVFDAPFRFDVGRVPNRHLSFGVGEHVCLGAHVARVELRVAFRYLLARLADAELAGPVERLRSSQVGGIKRLPIRYRLGTAVA
ncbi:MAG TPA: cytochrome P450, partial [Myxococcota bacterium]|nr:cytochrome P450 [Myxococcota bacterium]